MDNYKPVYTLPESYQDEWLPFHIAKKYRNILILSDIHIPYHDTEALTIAIDWAKKHEVDCVILNGDIVDFYGISKWSKDPTRPTVKTELDMLYQFLQWLHQELPVKIYYKDGNHEERITHYLRAKCAELYNVIEYRKEKLYDYASLDIEMIGNQRIIKAGKLPILHGHELQLKSVAVNPARSTFLKTYDSCLVGHLHKASEHTESDLTGKIITTWSVGCLCEMHPEYARINKWSHGFARVKLDDAGNFKVTNLRIYEGEVL